MRALAAQVGGAIIAIVSFALQPGAGASTPVDWALVQGVAAAIIGVLLALKLWWLPINVLFVPAAIELQQVSVHPAWFLGAFVMLLLLFWTTYRTRVPLFLTSREVCARLASMLPHDATLRMLDLGCGFGGVLSAMHRSSPHLHLTGHELAPLPAWIAQMRFRHIPNSEIRRRDFWREDLSSYDLVYAFLSPEVMSQLWQKVRAEMRPGSLFVSHAFVVAETAPDLMLPLASARHAPLYVWRL
ncbi:MAG: hypothetical protein ABI612_19630 [Betaproteobacteria bacterium]